MWDTIDRWLKTCEKKLRGDLPDVAKDLADINLREEVKFLRNRLEAEQSPVVFCHNDMQEGNILIRQDINDNNDEKTKIVLIGKYAPYTSLSFSLIFTETIFKQKKTRNEVQFYFIYLIYVVGM